MTDPRQPRTLHEVWTAAATAGYPAPLSKRVFQGLEHCQLKGRNIDDALETIAAWLRDQRQEARWYGKVQQALLAISAARESARHGDDNAAGRHAEAASRFIVRNKQLDPLRDLCDSVNLACDNTIVGWQGMAEQAATEAIEKLEAWLDANK